MDAAITFFNIYTAYHLLQSGKSNRMKIQCDVCNKDEASVFCTADEAALCKVCDRRVHHANKLASKHQRFSLLHPSAEQFPVCDVCQERRAFLFCQQDRAILCRECDLPIHSANEHTQKHNRFLLTGVKLSASSTLHSSSSASNSVLKNSSDTVPDPKSQSLSMKSSVAASPSISHTSMIVKNSPLTTITTTTSLAINKKGVGSTSSISEYLIETLPGWQVEDFLDSSCAPFGFCKSDDGMLQFLDGDVEGNLGSFSPQQTIGVWVPEAPSPLYSAQMGMQFGFKETNTKEATHVKYNRARLRDGAFIVPQISPPSIDSKRSKSLW